MNNNIFDDKIVIVTGSSRGLGKSIALAFAKSGAKLVINYSKSRNLADEVVDQINTIGGLAISIKADISKTNQVKSMIDKTIHTFGKIDILINNAGIFNDGLIKNIDTNSWDEVIKVNLNGVFNCTKFVIEPMTNKKYGRIINITSVQGQVGVIGSSSYSASKAGIVGFTKSAARELAKSNITVNAISPGFIDIGMLKRLPQKIQDDILKMIPLKRFGKEDEINEVVMFLASDHAGYITGQVINVNGGYYM